MIDVAAMESAGEWNYTKLNVGLAQTKERINLIEKTRRPLAMGIRRACELSPNAPSFS